MIIVVTFISIHQVWELLFHKIPLKIQEFNLCKNPFNHHALCQLLFYFFSPVLLIYCTFEKNVSRKNTSRLDIFRNTQIYKSSSKCFVFVFRTADYVRTCGGLVQWKFSKFCCWLLLVLLAFGLTLHLN